MTDPIVSAEITTIARDPRVTSLLSLAVSDVSTGTLDQVRAAYAGAIGKAFADLDPDQKAEAERWASGLASMVRFHRGGPAQLEIVRTADGTVQANILSGVDPRSSSASSTLILSPAANAAPTPPPPQRQAKPTTSPQGTRPTRAIGRPTPPPVRTAPPARGLTTVRGR